MTGYYGRLFRIPRGGARKITLAFDLLASHSSCACSCARRDDYPLSRYKGSVRIREKVESAASCIARCFVLAESALRYDEWVRRNFVKFKVSNSRSYIHFCERIRSRVSALSKTRVKSRNFYCFELFHCSPLVGSVEILILTARYLLLRFCKKY